MVDCFYEEKKKVCYEYISTIIISILFFTLFLYLIVVILPNSLLLSLGLPIFIIRIALISASLSGIIAMCSNLFRLQRKPFYYGFFSITQSLFLFAFIYLSLLVNASFGSIVIGRFLFVIFFFFISLFFLLYKKILKFTFRIDVFKWAFKFSLPTVFYSLSAFVFLSSDRFFIKFFLSNSDLAFYSAIYLKNVITATVPYLSVSGRFISSQKIINHFD